MHIAAMMLVDLRAGAIGLPSRAAADLAGQPVLRRSVARALAARNLDRLALLAPTEQHERIRELLGELANEPRLMLADLPANQAAIFGRVDPDRIRLVRRWSLSGWRGGISGACWFDELLAPAAMTQLAHQLQADAVVPLAPEAALADPALLDATVDLYRRQHQNFRLTLCPAPPGLGAICLATAMLSELNDAGQTVGRSLAYDPANPQPDLLGSDAAIKLPIELMACPHRFLADTARGLALLDRLIRTDSATQLPPPPLEEGRGEGASTLSAAQVVSAANALFADAPEPWPAEIDLELTSDRPLADALRPGRPLVPARGPADEAVIDRLCESIRAFPADDITVTLGGFGDALLHPRVLEITAKLKSAGALAVAVRTTGLPLTEQLIATLLDSNVPCPVDLIVVELDAATRETYQQLKSLPGASQEASSPACFFATSATAFDAVTAAMRLLLTERTRLAHPGPLLVAELVKCPATLADMEPFFDRWRLADEAHLAGLHNYAGQFQSPAGPGWPTAPPLRRPCRRISRRLTVLADGTVPLCDLDFKAACPLGRLTDRSLAEIWGGERLSQIRAGQRQQQIDDLSLCRACDQWHRP